MGLHFPNLEWSSNFGIKVIILLLVKFEVSPNENIVRKARRNEGVIFSTFSSKNYVGKLSWPNVLPLIREVMASTTSSKVNSWVILAFISSVTREDTLSQHFLWAFTMFGE
jgi:hypothetical protein